MPFQLPPLPLLQTLHPAPPPFDVLLRILSAPSSSTASECQLDSLSLAAALLRSHCQPQLLPSAFASFCSVYLSRRLVVLCGGRVRTRCLLLLLPPHTQRGLLSLVLSLPTVLQQHAEDTWLLLDEYCGQLLDERRRAVELSTGPELLLRAVECDCLLLLVQSVYARAARQLPAQLPPPPPPSFLLSHINHSTLLPLPLVEPQPHQPHAKQRLLAAQSQSTAHLVSHATPSAVVASEPLRPPLTPLVLLLQSMCANSGTDWSTVVQQSAEGSGQTDEDWTMQWEQTEQPVTVELCALDDDCFTSATQAGAPGAASDEAEETVAKHGADEQAQEEIRHDKRSREAVQKSIRLVDSSVDQLSNANESRSAAAAMQELLAALSVLRLHDLVGVFPTGSSSSLTDEQLRQHAALSTVIPRVDAIHSLPSSAALELSFTQPSSASLTPTTLPAELFYVFIRLLLSSSVSQQRAMVIVRHSMRHLVDAAAPAYTRYTEDALAHAVSTHPHAVYHALLTPLVTPSAVSTVRPQHAKLINVCMANNTARTDLSQQFAIALAHSLQVNASHSPAASALSVVPSLPALGVLVDCLQPAANCPLSPPLIAAVVSLLCALAALPAFASQDKPWMTRASSLLKRVMTDSDGAAACRARKAELMAGWSQLKPLKSTHLLAAMQAEKLDKL